MFYGRIKDTRDDRDHKFSLASPVTPLIVPDAHTLKPWLPPPMNQKQNSTCTVHGTTAAYRYEWLNNDLPDLELSRAQLYQDAGVIEGNTGDVGRQIRDVVKALATTGVAAESLWPYENVGQPVPENVRVDAATRTIREYAKVGTDRRSINTAIFIGHPVIIGVSVFKQFESEEAYETGFIRMPSFGETEVGEHCMLLAGYDPQRDEVLNSWGFTWGQEGYASFPRGYLEKYGSDFWTIFKD